MQRARDLLLLTLFCYVCGDTVWRKNGHGLYVPIWSGESVLFEYLTPLLNRVLLSMQANDWLTDWPHHSTRETSDGRNCLFMTFCLQVGDLKRSVCFLGELGCYRAGIQEALRKEILSSLRIWVTAVEVRFHACPNFIEMVTLLVVSKRVAFLLLLKV
jgi:hypothetical protein